MRDVLDRLLPWWEDDQQVALATVVGTWRSAPRQPGAAMLVGTDGEAVGSVSGGCVEGAVYELGEQVIGTGTPVLQRYGVSDDEAMGVGLTCGGILDIYVERVSPADFPELGEVESVVWIGLAHLFHPNSSTRYWHGPVGPFAGIRYGDHTVWGLTLGTLRNLAGALDRQLPRPRGPLLG